MLAELGMAKTNLHAPAPSFYSNKYTFITVMGDMKCQDLQVLGLH